MMLSVLQYIAVFGLGPIVVVGLLRRSPDLGSLRVLGLGVVALIFAAMALQFAGVQGGVTGGVFWLSWVLSMVLMVQVLRMVLDDRRADRWTAAVGVVGAVLPWFGILILRSMAE